jgi:hypothetical protein
MTNALERVRRWMLKTRSIAAVVTMIVLSIALVGCGERGPTPVAASPPEEAPSPDSSPAQPLTEAHPLVGEWAQELRCEEMVSSLLAADQGLLLKDAVWGSFFWPEPETIEEFRFRASDPCRGAEPRLHSHFFTAEGAFGSLDENGRQVDDGDYHVRGNGKLVINESTFRYEIKGDSLTLDPVLPSCSDCFEAMWMIAVASPARAWERVA